MGMKAETNDRDECRTCVVRGDIEQCMKTQCVIHESWYAQALRRQINRYWEKTPIRHEEEFCVDHE